MRAYLKYELKGALPRLAIFALIGVILLVLPQVIVRESYPHFDAASLAIYTIFLAAFVAIYEFNFSKKARHIDTYYALPLTRPQLFLTKLLTGAVEIAGAVTLVFGLLILAHLKYRTDLKFQAFFSYYPVLLIGALALYGFFVAIFSRANSTLDGIIFGAGWILAGVMLCGVIYAHVHGLNGLDMLLATPLLVVTKPAAWFSWLITSRKPLHNMYQTDWMPALDIACVTLWMLLGLVGALLSALLSAKAKAENVGHLSNSLFGYKVLIPLLIITMMLSLGPAPYFGFVGYIFVSGSSIALGIILLMIYRRSFRINWRWWLLVLIPVTVGINAVLILYFTFGK